MSKQFHHILKFCLKIILFKLNFNFLHTIFPHVQISGVLDFFLLTKRKGCVYLSLAMTTLTRGFSHVKLCPERFCTKNCASHLSTAHFNTKLSQDLFVGCNFAEQYQWSCLDFLQTKFTDNTNPLESPSRTQRECD